MIKILLTLHHFSNTGTQLITKSSLVEGE